MRGEYVEVIPNRRVVFTWGWDAPGAAVGPGGSTVEIELEPISSRATRMRVITRGGVFFDGSTATEIVMQTEKALGVSEANASAGAGRRFRY